jgi:energy-coupling factor transporter ATP-binding protein EcfA2
MSRVYEAGSEWRRWDLHIHTPESVLNNGFGSNWDAYVQKLFRILIEKNIAAVGITDYFTIDGHKKLSEEYLANDAKLQALFSTEEIDKIKKILVIPNIEFRSDIFVGSNSINFHVLFSEDVSPRDIEEKFLHEIDFVYQGDPNNADRRRKLKVGNLVELGTRLKGEHAAFKESPLFVGMLNAVVDDKQVSEILAHKKDIFGGKYLFALMADEDLSAVSWNSRDHLTRKTLVQKSNVLFSSNSKTRDWALGKPPYVGGPAKFIAEFITLKPCAHGSDAHEYQYIGHPCAKRGDSSHNCSTDRVNCDLRLCWIKADPTFEGLKQVLYEPEDRIAIQSADPTPLKSLQSIAEIDIQGATLDPELSFKDTKLPLNQALVAVTGGKGSGKTALVDLIANIYENRAFCDDKNSFVKRISTGNTNVLHTTIGLKNAQQFTKEVQDPVFVEGVSIVYVAQGELEKHVDDPAHLETYINNLIFESNEVKDSALLFDYQNISDELSSLGDDLQTRNKLIFGLENETDWQIEEKLKSDGKKLDAELQDTVKKITELSKGLSTEEREAAEAKQKQLTDLRDRKTQLNELGLTIKTALKFADEDRIAFNQQVEKINILAATLKFPNIFRTIEYLDADILRSFIGTIRNELRKTIGEIEKFQKDLEEKEKGIKEHARLLDKKKELEKAIQEIHARLKGITEKKTQLDEARKMREAVFADALNKRVEQRNKYLAIIASFSANKNDILKDLEFTAELTFDHNRFVETMSELVDLRKIRIGGSDANDSDIKFFMDAMSELVADPSFDKTKSAANLGATKLLAAIVGNQKKAETISRLTIYDSVFADYLNITPSVKYKKVRLSKLSIGQKATVLLKIYLAQGETPIVIDSHDDHLDNEFIMDELVKALRQAKQQRQVIIVSNNGNVVVNSDAEQVIIACRDDQGQISYMAGALENQTLRSKLLAVLEGGEEAFSKRQKKYRLNL